MRVLIRLTGYALHFRGSLIIAWITLILATGFYLAVPNLLGTAVDEALEFGSTARLWQIGALLIAVTTARGLLQYVNLYLGESIGHRVSYTLRNAIYDKLQRLSFAFHDREHTGNLMSKATVDVDMARMFINTGLVRSLQTILLVVSTAAILMRLDWQLALASLVFVPVIAYRAAAVSIRMRSMWMGVQQEMGRMTTVLQENLTGMRVVKAFGAEKYEEAKFGVRTRSVFDRIYATERLRASNMAMMQLIFWASTGVILWLGGRIVVEERLTTGELTQFILYVSLLVQPVRMMGQMVSTFARAISAGERIFDVLDADSPVRERPNAQSLNGVRGEVAFENVSFTYDQQPTLRQVNLEVKAGQVVAFLGSAGSGKTTMAHLLARFYEVGDGRITIDAIDIRDVTLESLRRTVGIVQQDVYLFSSTIAENIAYGKLDATQEMVLEAAKTAQIHDEIMDLPHGYSTMVGERGVTLSGGQRQRLSIARTLLVDPPILVLDDSTASVDAETESKIQQAMANVVRGRTTFIIAHRLTSIQHATLIVVLDRGHVIEMGTPHQLLANEGFYRHTAELQNAAVLPSLPTGAETPVDARGGAN